MLVNGITPPNLFQNSLIVDNGFNQMDSNMLGYMLPGSLTPMNQRSKLSLNSPTVINPVMKYQDLIYPYGIRQRLLVTKPQINQDAVDDPEYQQKMNEYLYYRVLDYWLPSSEFCYILNYLNVSGSKVSLVSSVTEAKKNKKCNLDKEQVEKAIDYIEKHIFSRNDMRRLSIKTMNILGFKWYNLGNSQEDRTIAKVAITYIKRKMKIMAGIGK